MNKEDYQKAFELLKDSKPMAEGPTHWSIDETEDGWMIRFTGPVSGAMHPKNFCELMIEQLNKEE